VGTLNEPTGDAVPWLGGISGQFLPPLIESDDPLICVIAGPGSGKTTGIKRRVQRLVQGKGVQADRIFVGTFTRAIAGELQAALGEEIRVSTLHALARRLLQENPAALGSRKLRFLLGFEEDAMLYDVGVALPGTGNQVERRRLLNRTQSAQSERTALPDAKFAGQVEEWLIRHGGMLIGEVVPLAAQALEAHDIPTGQFDEVIIDEYQDLTALEQHMVEHVWSRRGSLIVLGDDDQSIYSFRFNHPEGLSDFIQRWASRGEEVVVLPLPENRRCGSSIVDLANVMMAEAGSPKDPMLAVSSQRGVATAVHWNTIEDEIEGLASYIRSRADVRYLVLVPRRFIGRRLRDRIGADARTAFHQQAVERGLVQERFTAASLMANEGDRIALRAWFGFKGNEPVHASQRNAAAVASFAALPGSALEVANAIAEGTVAVSGSGRGNVIRRAERLMQLRRDVPDDLRERIEYLFDPSLVDQAPEDDEEKRSWIVEDLQALREAALGFVDTGDEDLKTILDKLRYRIATRAPLSDEDHAEAEPRVLIMTLHSAKGLEGEAIILAGLADQIVPGPEVEDPVAEQKHRAEQRRLLYVSLTRARTELILSWARSVGFQDAMQNQIRRDTVFTDDAGERRVGLSRSKLLPANLGAPRPGPQWLRAVD
jgi:DNA helicase-2/ATP-dependent DNA helicase PcrA